MVIWIVLFLHKAGIVDHVIHVGMSWTNISGYTTVTGRKSSSHLEKLVGRESSNSETNQQDQTGNNYGVSQFTNVNNLKFLQMLATVCVLSNTTATNFLFPLMVYSLSRDKRWVEKVLGGFLSSSTYIHEWNQNLPKPLRSPIYPYFCQAGAKMQKYDFLSQPH